MWDELHEECGVFGVYHVEEAASLTYYGLHALQHRGQEGCGIAVSDGTQVKSYKGRGLIAEVFGEEQLQSLKGNIAVGHVRYSTAGGNILENVQPMLSVSHQGTLAMVHNGQIVNATQLRNALEDAGSIFQGTSDSEIILHLIQREKGSLLEKIKKTAIQLEGSFAFLIMSGNSIYAVRDCYGLRPLSYAKVQDGYCISSETCTYDVISGSDIIDVKPGEIVKFCDDRVEHYRFAPAKQHAMCAMEYIYFSRPDSTLDGINVHLFRKASGALLAKKDKGIEADIVIGVPDSSISAASGYAEASGIPYEMGLIKNRYVARTFIQPTQQLRDRGVRMKLSAIRSIVEGKRIILIDDSIVRGTTSKRIVQLLKEAGAKEIHMRIASPMIKYPCFYGVDTSTREELIAAHKSCEELCTYIQADSLRFLSIEDMTTICKGGLCTACFDGKYVTKLYDYAEKLKD
ncbi:amidophosphoribosyltransferase [Merdibacter massiliensis]|uniref:amidophosphoribosyltransferase n=1 Tax=Merdibacter massiliensis TaxID=1871030 RepID=UPI00096A2A7C|nr:amidophosphoribosyltransferase [Merdibacter massiliensis]